MPFTLVSFHAHPDDEVLLMGGTLAKAAQEGHRVVLVVATSGGAGLAAPELAGTGRLAQVRERELHASAQALGCARVVLLGYQDSGLHGQEPSPFTFVHADPDAAAERLAEVLAAEQADVLTIYDAAGGYGHPDHRQVHVVGRLAAAIAHTPVVLEATLDRTLLTRLAGLVRLIPGGLGGVRFQDLAAAYTPRSAITHRVDVRAQLPAKRQALAAHASQAGAARGPRTVSMLLRLPRPLFSLVLGREWFTEHGRAPGRPSGDIFASLRGPAAS